MSIRATSDRRFYLRFLLIGLAALGFALYCVYDGLIGYPNQRERALKYIEFEEAGQEDEWREYAKQQGWPTANPGHPKGEADFIMQYIMAGGAGLASLILLTIVLRARNRWIELDGAELTSSWGQTLSCDQIMQIEKKRWRDKGIARIKYEQDGRQRRFMIDDFKFVRDDTDAILYEIEGQIEMERIVGGPPEFPPGQKETASADEQESADDEIAQQSTDTAADDSD